MPRKPELLSPAGSPESLAAALEAGADAVYLAGKRFGARKHAGNFSDCELREALRKVHISGAKAYLAVNTLLYDDELAPALSFVAEAYSWGADAVIVQDLGLAALVLDTVPIDLHASTQFGVHDVEGAKAAKELGFARAIVARETPIADIADISDAIGTEAFVHGALCYAHSGQCLMSSFIGGRSGNRGNCSQPCRMEYVAEGLKPTGPYLLSTRDLNSLSRLGELVGAGVSALKIEGRMRSPEYVALATSAYRKALDTGETPSPDDARMLALAFNREFTHGYSLGARHASLTNHASQGNAGLRLGRVVSVRGKWVRVALDGCYGIIPGDGLGIGGKGGNALAVDGSGPTVDVKLDFPARAGDEVRLTASRAMAEAARRARGPRKRPVSIHVAVESGRALKMTASAGGISVEVDGPLVSEAEKRPLTAESVEAAVAALGDTPFEARGFDATILGRPFVQIGTLKSLRRSLLALLERRLSESFLRERPSVPVAPAHKADRSGKAPCLVARTLDPGIAGGLLDAGADVVLVDSLYGLPSSADFISMLSGIDGVALELPRVTMGGFWRSLGDSLDGWRGPLMAHSLGARRRLGRRAVYGGFSLNVANSRAALEMSRRFVSLEVSPELGAAELAQVASAADAWVAVHGRQELMVSEDCVPGSAGACANCGEGHSDGGLAERCGAMRAFVLEDRKGYRFPAIVDADCRTHVYNSAETCLADDIPSLVGAGIGGLVLNLQLKDEGDAVSIVQTYKLMLSSFLSGGTVSANDLIKLKRLSSPSLTSGHFRARAP